MASEDVNLVDTFPPASRNIWLKFVTDGLRGDAFDSLIKTTDDGLERGPLSDATNRPDNVSRYARTETPLRDTRHWHIVMPVRDPDMSFANQQAIDDLKGGASALDIHLDPDGPTGVSVKNASDLNHLFEQVHVDLIPVIVRGDCERFGSMVAENTSLRDTPLTWIDDPLANALTSGASASINSLHSFVKTAPKAWRTITVNAAAVHDLGGTEAQELSYMAAAIVEHINAVGPEQVQQNLTVRLAADQDGHLGIAKIRAARQIYAQIATSYGLSDLTVPIYSVTSLRMLQTKDPWTNMLRIMAAGFGSVCGGADYIMTRPFTDKIGLPTPFGHRIARNMQLMMMEESHLGHVKDAAYGSYFHENMTAQLAQTAWTEFQAIMSGGGIGELVENGVFKATVAGAAQRRADQDAPILGVSLHPADALRTAKTRPARHTAQSA